jgi:hypothetical protein
LKNSGGRYKLISKEKLTGLLLFVLALLWFYDPGEYVLIANQDLSLFLTTPEYLLSFLNRPGGLLEYLGSFLGQFFRFRLAGAVVLSMVIAAGYFAALGLFKRISGKKPPILAGIISALLLMGMHNFYPHQLSHSLGLILAIFLASMFPADRSRRLIFLALAIPVIYLASGGFVWYFCGLVLAAYLVGKGKTDIPSALLIILYPAIIIFFGASFLYLDPWKELMISQLPFGPQYGNSPWPLLFVAWIFLMILLLRIPIGGRKLHRVWRLGFEIAFSLLALVLILHFSFKRKNAEFYTIEKMAIEEDWDGLLSYTAKHPSSNLFGSFYTNLALANKGLLCEALFQYPQGFGRRGLCFEWEEKAEILRRGSDFFWTIHFVNEAHHWAFESLIIDGFTQRNLKRLIQTELVRGNFKIAEKYIHQLGRALFQKKLAGHYAAFLYKPEAIAKDPELGPRVNSRMPQDFFADGADLEKNLRLVLANHPYNPQAMDYLMALYLLEKEVDKIPPFLPGYLETHGGRLPTLLDESLLVFQITHRETPLADLRVSPATIQRFDEYTRILRQYRNPEEAARMLFPDYQSTFWFHLNFNTLANR